MYHHSKRTGSFPIGLANRQRKLYSLSYFPIKAENQGIDTQSYYSDFGDWSICATVSARLWTLQTTDASFCRSLYFLLHLPKYDQSIDGSLLIFTHIMQRVLLSVIKLCSILTILYSSDNILSINLKYNVLAHVSMLGSSTKEAHAINWDSSPMVAFVVRTVHSLETTLERMDHSLAHPDI